MLSSLKTLLCGIAMGAADLIPGISGGTVAFILGIYDKLLFSLKNPVKSFIFLFPLLTGMAFSLLFLAGFLDILLKNENHRPLLYSLFSGLICGSALFLARKIKWSYREFSAFILSLLIAYFLSSVNFSEEKPYAVFMKLNISAENYKEGWLDHLSKDTVEAMLAKKIIDRETLIKLDDVQIPVTAFSLNLSPHIDFKAFGAGMVAISAMLLPGISGSYLLNLMGVYEKAIASLSEVKNNLVTLTFDLEPFLFLTSLGFGILAGIIAFSKAVSSLLSKFPSISYASLTGFMLGSIKTLYPFYSYIYVYNPLKSSIDLVPLHPIFPSQFTLPFLLFILGIYIVIKSEKLAFNT